MPQAGYSSSQCLDLDAGFVAFANRFRRERDATVGKWVKPEKPPHKGQVRVQAPKHERDVLLGWLGIDPEAVDQSEAMVGLAEMAGIDAATWESLPDYPDQEE